MARPDLLQRAPGDAITIRTRVACDREMRETVPPPPSGATSGAFSAAAPARDFILMVCMRGHVRWVSLTQGKDCVIGRGDKNDIVVRHERVSRQHAVIRCGAYPELEDLRSLNGTIVEGRKLDPGERVRLREGTAIQIGPVTLILHSTLVEAVGVDEHDKTPSMLPGMVLKDEKMLALRSLVDDVAPSDLSVLILGETGTGKELLARMMHDQSPRQNGPFVRLNCAALPETLAESELFGHERGAFTGADRQKTGLIEAADGGTLFLDEVGELTLTLQAKLLRVLDAGEVLPVGAVKAKKVAVRIVAATNRDLREAVSGGDFRADLFYRLSGVVVNVPPLRNRRNDIPALVEFFAQGCAGRASKPVPLFAAEAMSALCAYEWPGNVRELKHVIERVVLLAKNGFVTAAELQLDAARLWVPPSTRDLPSLTDGEYGDSPTRVTVERVPEAPARSKAAQTDRERIVDALARAHGNQGRAARLLGISRRTLINRLDEYGLPRPRKTD